MDNRSANSNGDAVFIGMQQTRSGETFPLYNITADNHPLRGSTVSETTLNEMNLQVPEQYNAHNDGNLSDTREKEKTDVSVQDCKEVNCAWSDRATAVAIGTGLVRKDRGSYSI